MPGGGVNRATTVELISGANLMKKTKTAFADVRRFTNKHRELRKDETPFTR